MEDRSEEDRKRIGTLDKLSKISPIPPILSPYPIALSPKLKGPQEEKDKGQRDRRGYGRGYDLKDRIGIGIGEDNI